MEEPAEPNRTPSAVIAIIVAAVGGIVAFALLRNPPPAPAPPLAIAATPAPTETPAPFPSAASYVARPVEAAATPIMPVGSIPAWESTIDGILRLNVTETQMARMLINILPTLPEDGQIEAANHITNLLPDSDYDALHPLLVNTTTHESVLSVLFTDLMNRDDTTKLNAFLDIAQVPNHPFQSEAVNDLQIYVGQDFGTDWPKWKSAVTQYLKTASAQ